MTLKSTVNHKFQQAVTAHWESRLEEVKRLYKFILKAQPTNGYTNRNLVVLLIS